MAVRKSDITAAHRDERKEEKSYQLLFSSYGVNSAMVREKLAKVISQDGSLWDKTCLVIPYAGYDVEKTFEREKQGLIAFGFDPEKIQFARERMDIAVGFPDYIYVPGGDPFKLLKTMREREMLRYLAECVKSRRAIYIGVSAGAYIASQSIHYVLQLEDNNVITDGCFDALGLISESVLCHYDHYTYATLKTCQEVTRSEVVAMNDDQLLMYKNGEWSYIE